MSPDKRRERTAESVVRLTEMYTSRMTAWLFAHEFEHGNKYWPKFVMKLTSSFLPLAAGSAVIITSGHAMPEGVQFASVLATLVGPIAGSIAGKSVDEQFSYNAADKNFPAIMSSITVNPKIFNEKVLGLPEAQ